LNPAANRECDTSKIQEIEGRHIEKPRLVSAPKIAAAMDQLHHSFTQLSVGEADFHALGCAPGAWKTVAKLVFDQAPQGAIRK